MIQLSDERVQEMLHKETVKKEDRDTILRSIYARYMRLYERYFADIDALNEDAVAEMRNFHEETISLIKYYLMDIPEDTCGGIRKFEKMYTDKLLGSDWRRFLFGQYEDFKAESRDMGAKSEDYYKAAFAKKALTGFYDAMEYIFRPGFGTESEAGKQIMNGISGLLFGKEKK